MSTPGPAPDEVVARLRDRRVRRSGGRPPGASTSRGARADHEEQRDGRAVVTCDRAVDEKSSCRAHNPGIAGASPARATTL